MQNLKLLTTAETRLVEANKQCDQMLEGKQLELSRHLKEISQRNDQVFSSINDLCHSIFICNFDLFSGV